MAAPRGWGSVISGSTARWRAFSRWAATSRPRCFFRLAGGGLGDLPVFASVSGYEQTTQGAIVTGGCNWACSFGPVLTAGLSGGQLDDPDAQSYETTIDGRRFRVVLSGLDRSLTSGDADDTGALVEAARRELAGWPLLTPGFWRVPNFPC